MAKCAKLSFLFRLIQMMKMTYQEPRRSLLHQRYLYFENVQLTKIFYHENELQIMKADLASRRTLSLASLTSLAIWQNLSYGLHQGVRCVAKNEKLRKEWAVFYFFTNLPSVSQFILCDWGMVSLIKLLVSSLHHLNLQQGGYS